MRDLPDAPPSPASGPHHVNGDRPLKIREMVAQTPLGRLGQPEDIARVAVFLASEDAGWVTGERLTVSGGWR
jgi:NAD(P)-dependent dehydrogenase (short-subunit alcohol dehydrogenase family)